MSSMSGESLGVFARRNRSSIIKSVSQLLRSSKVNNRAANPIRGGAAALRLI